LANGKLLLEGGDGTNGTFSTAVASAELFDPSTRTWTATASLSTARDYFTATLLRDGRVLVAGGYDASNNSLASTEIYDPSAATWSQGAPMNVSRGYHTATLLSDGRVLVAGGDTGSSWAPTRTAEIFDPVANTWTLIASSAGAHAAGVAALLPNGRVLVAGGYQPGGTIQQTGASEIFDPATATWSSVPPMATPRTCADIAVVGGKVLVAGGENDSSGYVASAELFDPATSTWTPTDTMRARHACAATTQLADGRVVVAGGLGPLARGSSSQTAVEIYNPATGRWRQAASLVAAGYLQAAGTLADGRVVVAGGYSNLAGLQASQIFLP
jgi:N-acetylneuraminic acid mutarotase